MDEMTFHIFSVLVPQTLGFPIFTLSCLGHPFYWLKSYLCTKSKDSPSFRKSLTVPRRLFPPSSKCPEGWHWIAFAMGFCCRECRPRLLKGRPSIQHAGPVAAFKVATPYSLYVCPEGQNVTLTCRLLGPVDKGHDVTFYKTWYRSSRGEVQTCSERRPIRNLTFQDLHLHHGGHQAANTSHDLAQRHGLESASDRHGNFSITMRNLTLLDSGLYCCLVVELRHHHSEHRVHGAMELQVQTGKDAPSNCVAYPSSSQESENITAAALATGACIVGILCLPLILLLVYKQRQAASNRRAQELVRMDSNIQGIENPGFEASPPAQGIPEAKVRHPLSYVAQRQPSESGRHLLSEPSTPLSPPGPGDVFFPSLDPVPDSPNFEVI
ncbi:V-type immunoglobulin domain-containing suppressor of T-cell activation isoform X1 [Symphalangus syndactylus]|uniref:V-type immunoglobulin domain-containing suppressor of T-cell activation isoform X1 n=1 Tax=Symphalangus syndactylus TaxID=9590 RepID=UPI0024417E05|nr:V-type immunoglobulin domain-containing suppressor of T-cell activation isoform X1 [Symphalangus syndactylus]